jgi:2-aminoadipate transaminase
VFAERIAALRPSPIRAVLGVLDRPGMISFAGGLPATELLPVWSGTVPPDVLQYGPTEGEPALRSVVSERLRELGIDVPADRVLILSGSQQGIDLVTRLFVDEGTPVAVESPTYLAALQVLRLYGARFVDLSAFRAGTADCAPRLAYTVPTFANPTGRCATTAERDSLAQACLDAGTVLFEDDPYRDLVYRDCERTPIATRMTGGSWVYQGSFSKTFAPGLRLGFLAASEDLFGRLVMLKQATDLHSSRLSQHLVHGAITDPGWSDRLHGLARFYRDRLDVFDAALRRHLAGLADWDTPDGGLFFWLRLHDPVDTRELLPEAIERGVAFMPGEEFFAGAPQLGTLRLNFSHADAGQVDRGLAVLRELLERKRPATTRA